jgi:hypothetical protein
MMYFSTEVRKEKRLIVTDKTSFVLQEKDRYLRGRVVQLPGVRVVVTSYTDDSHGIYFLSARSLMFVSTFLVYKGKSPFMIHPK